MLQAAAEVTQRGLAYITLLGDPETVRAEAEKMGIDLSLVDVVSPVVRGQGLGFRRGRRIHIAYMDALVNPHCPPFLPLPLPPRPSLLRPPLIPPFHSPPPGLGSVRGRPRGGPQEEGAAA